MVYMTQSSLDNLWIILYNARYSAPLSLKSWDPQCHITPCVGSDPWPGSYLAMTLSSNTAHMAGKSHGTSWDHPQSHMELKSGSCCDQKHRQKYIVLMWGSKLAYPRKKSGHLLRYIYICMYVCMYVCMYIFSINDIN